MRTGQAALGVSVFWPRVGKVQVNFPDLALVKNRIEIFRIKAQEKEVGKLCLRAAQESAVQDARVHLYADKIDVRVLFRKGMDELSLSHADFNVKGIIISKKETPLSFLLFRFLYDKGACLNKFFGAFNVP